MGRIKKQFWLSEKENKELIRKAKLSGLTQTAVIRILLTGYEPRERPDDRFYKTMGQMSSISNNLNQIAVKANKLGFIDVPMLKEEIYKLNKFQLQVESTYLTPAKSDLVWERD